MGASKRINTGNYSITTFPNDGNPLGNVDITTNTLMVYGNLRVTGTTTNVQAYDTTLSIFRLNANLTVANAQHQDLVELKMFEEVKPVLVCIGPKTEFFKASG
jgi:hypothetical protein